MNLKEGEVFHGIIANILDYDIVVSLNSSHNIMFTFIQILLGKAWTSLFPPAMS